MRREISLGRAFTIASFERACASFRETYNVAPTRASCAPDVLARFCELYESSVDRAHAAGARFSVDGIPLVAAILAPGTIVFEGEVDETKMGDW